MPEQEPSRDLPAPYRSPWGALLEDLRAVLASLRLELWQLWRRNRQGLLPLPAVWPKGLAAWFWPGLLLVTLAALLSALLLLGRNLHPGDRAGRASPSASPKESPVPSPVAVVAAGEGSPKAPPPPAPAPASGEPPKPLASPPRPVADSPASPRERGPGQASRELPAPQPAPAEQRPGDQAPTQEPAPLLAAFAESDPQGLLLEARPRPAAGELVLVLSPGWLQQPLPLRQRLVAAWQQRALEEGYERLLLETSAGQLLARPALVGSGMILLTPVAPPDADRA